MGNVVAGMAMGFCIGALLAILFSDNRALVSVTILVAAILIGGFIGGYINHEESSVYRESYAVAKQTIEESLAQDNLTGYERVALVTEATEQNEKLADYKYRASKWYGFTLDKKILDLEYIDLSAANE